MKLNRHDTDRLDVLTNIIVSLLLVRLTVVSFLAVLPDRSELQRLVLDDNWHHYQLGFLLLLLGWQWFAGVKKELALALGWGLVLDQWPVLLTDLGLTWPVPYMYGLSDPVFWLTQAGLLLVWSWKRQGRMR